MRRISDDERRRRLLRRQGLIDGPGTFHRLCDSLVAVHSTDPVSVYLAAHARGSANQPADVERELYEDRRVVRMLGMRRTLFVVPAGLIAAVQRGYTDDFARRERTRLAGWLETTGVAHDGARHIDRMVELVREFLDDTGEAGTREITSSIPELEIRFTPPVGSAAGTVSVGSRIVLLMTASGDLVRTRPLGSWISAQYRYTTIESWVGNPIDPIDPAHARAILARAWLGAFGPGTVADLKWWTGWNLGQTRAALEAVGAVEVELEAGSGHVLAGDDAPEPDAPDAVSLLPALDSTPMGWKERDWYLGPHGKELFDRNGNVGPTVWWNGRIVGGWAQTGDGEIRIELLEDIPASARDAADEAAHALGDFVGEVRFTPRFRTPLERRLRS